MLHNVLKSSLLFRSKDNASSFNIYQPLSTFELLYSYKIISLYMKLGKFQDEVVSDYE